MRMPASVAYSVPPATAPRVPRDARRTGRSRRGGGQQPPRRERPVRLASRGTRGAVAGGTEYATEAGMRMYYSGGNAVDAGVATMLAAAVVEFSHFGLGGEAPILVRTKDGKVHAIAGVGTMPKLATAQFFRDHKLTAEEMVSC